MTQQRNALVLGLAGLVPFWGLAIAASVMQGAVLQVVMLYALLAWGALILAFLSGARWAMILDAPNPSARRMMLFGAIPAVSLGALLLPPVQGLAVLTIAYTVLLVLEIAPKSRVEAPTWYPRLRSGLSVGAILAMCVAWAAA